MCKISSNFFIFRLFPDSLSQDQAGGGLQCNPLAVTAAATLLAAAGPCDQQNAADQFVDLAKKLGSQQMLSLAQIFTQQPRNTVSPTSLLSNPFHTNKYNFFIQPNSLFVPYCQQAPANPELNGLFQCQYVGANPSTFVGGVAVGGPGTIPFGKTNPLSPPGSCPANPGGPIAAGSQLVDITKNPNAPGGDGGLSSATANSHGAADGGSSSQTVKATAAAGPSAATGIGSKPTVVAAVAAIPTSAATSSSPPAGFQFTNAKDAQVLNAGFANLTPTSACTGMYLCSSTNTNPHFNPFFLSFFSFLSQPVKMLAFKASLPNALEENTS